ncbi:PIN domain-containing protein [Acidiferrobacter sp. SPIII_3]|uniref:PIN domain-containing protein n=1 Tax=Acidiferrobacter sp. SPIII_3 TaxID=1281578 RepID=UPI00197AEDE9|nr:PIN domain-containing protein [Acidiferrobacter sp. SPIII_3]
MRGIIAIDTNVLLQRILDDDDGQAASARRLFECDELLLITEVVLVEAVWTLTGKRYKATKDDVRALVVSLLEEPNVVFWDREVIWSALDDFLAARPVKTANGLKVADFADALIMNTAKAAARDRHLACLGTYTFDRAALEIDGTKSPE